MILFLKGTEDVDLGDPVSLDEIFSPQFTIRQFDSTWISDNRRKRDCALSLPGLHVDCVVLMQQYWTLFSMCVNDRCLMQIVYTVKYYTICQYLTCTENLTCDVPPDTKKCQASYGLWGSDGLKMPLFLFRRAILTCKVGQTDLVLAWYRGSLVGLHMQDHKSVCSGYDLFHLR